MAQYFTPNRSTLAIIPGSGHDVHTRQSTLGISHDVNIPQHTLFPNSHNHSNYYLADFIMEALSQETRWSFTIIRPLDNENILKVLLDGQEQYLIILWPMHDEVVLQLRKVIERSMSSNTEGSLIIVLKDNSLQDEKTRLQILTNITHRAIIIVPTLQYEYTHLDNCTDICTALDLYTWFPRGTSKHCGEFQLARISQWVVGGDGRFLKPLDLHPNKSLTDVQNCTATVYDTKVPSIFRSLEIEILKLIMNSLSLTVTFVQNSADAQIIFGSLQLKFQFKTEKSPYHISYPHLFKSLRWVFKCGKPIPRQGNFIKVFTWSLWMALSLICLVAALATFWIYKSSREPPRSASEYFLTVWSVIVGVSVPQMPRTGRLRIFFLMWVYYCFAISTVFQAFFTSFLVEPGLQKQTSTLEEMLQSGTKCIYFTRDHDFLSWCVSNTICSNCSNVCDDTVACLDFFLKSDNYAILTNEVYTKVMLPYPEKKYFLCPTKDEEKQTFHIMLVSKRSALISTINTKILSMVESGIVEKLREKTAIHIRNTKTAEETNIFAKQWSPNLNTSKESNAQSDNTESQYFVFTASHLKVAFYLLLIGYCASCAIFITEILMYKLQYQFIQRRQLM